MGRRLPVTGLAAIAATASALVFTPAASAVDEVNTKRLREAVTVNGILGHERAFQRIANRNGGTRASGTSGYDASAAYVKGRLEAAGYEVTEQTFTFPFFRQLAPSVLSVVTPAPKAYTEETDFATLRYSGSGSTTASLVPVDVQIPPGPTPSSSTSGCEASDFVGFPTGAIALLQRGTCTFEVKATNAQAAGATGAVIFNEGQPGRTGVLAGTLGNPTVTIPVLGATFAIGAELVALARAGVVTATVAATTDSDLDRETTNIIADTPEGNADETVVVGAHLDSVVAGPGINDNGSGSAGILEIAEEMSELDVELRQKVRFAFWGAEESGLLGSEHYVNSLDDGAFGELYANLNFDMIGSPNYVRFVYDGDGSDTPSAGPPGSAQIEQIFNSYFASQGLATEPTAFDGRSDYGPFILQGIPAGGLFSGAEGIKTPEQATIFGGTAGVAYDPNYHKAGDTILNLNTKALAELGDAAAHATLTLARSRTGFFEDGSRRGRTKAADLELRGSNAVR